MNQACYQLGAVVLSAILVATGCDDGETAAREERKQLVDELARSQARAAKEREALQDLREQDRRVLQAKAVEADSDASAAVMLWTSTALALAVVIVVLAQEHRLRRAAEGAVGRQAINQRGRSPP